MLRRIRLRSGTTIQSFFGDGIDAPRYLNDVLRTMVSGDLLSQISLGLWTGCYGSSAQLVNDIERKVGLRGGVVNAD